MRLPPTNGLIRLPLYLALALLTQCSKCKQDPTPAKPEDQLPPATQTGAGTFGCLLNGQPWTPSGFNGYPHFLVNYDPTYHGGSLNIRTYRYPTGAKQAQYIGFGGDQLNKPGTYTLTALGSPTPPGPYGAFFSDNNLSSPCDYYSVNQGATVKGQFTITRLDLSSGIISGTLECTLSQPGCDTIKITKGRFDGKF